MQLILSPAPFIDVLTVNFRRPHLDADIGDDVELTLNSGELKRKFLPELFKPSEKVFL